MRPSAYPEPEKRLTINNGWLQQAEHQLSTFFSLREPQDNISLLVIHNISLPAGSFGGTHITDLFLGQLNANAHPSFDDIAQRLNSWMAHARTADCEGLIRHISKEWVFTQDHDIFLAS